MSDSLNILLSGLEKRPDFPDQPARSKVRNAWVYFWVGNNETTLRADENGNVLRHVSGPADEKESYQEPFVTEEGTKAEVAFSLGDKPLRRADIEPQLRLFTLKNDLSDPGGPIFVPKSGTKKVRVLPKTHIRAGFPSEPLKGDEISFLADYPEPWSGTLRGESTAARDDIWHPGSRSFDVVANTPNRGKKRVKVMPVGSIGNIFGEMQEHQPDSIRRLNVFTHATPGLISLSGRFDGKDTLLDPAKDDKDGFPLGGGLDGSVVSWLNFSDDGKRLRNDVRTRFTEFGEILLFLCNGGLGRGVSLAIDLAACLNVRVLAYTQPIGYYVDFPNNRVDRNLTSIGLVPDAEFKTSIGGRIRPGYPFVVEAPFDIPDGSHVRPDRTFPKPQKPAP